MSNKSLRAWVIAVVAAIAGLQAHAAGLGRLEVKSALGDTFRAEISILAEKNEIGSLSARMGSADAFQRAGLIYGAALSDMRVSVQMRPNGEPYVLITSLEKLNEPVLDLLVDLSWASGRVTREYTAFIDPPFLIAEREKQRSELEKQRAAAAAAAASTPETKAVPSEPLPEPQPLPEPVPTVPAETAAAPGSEMPSKEMPAAEEKSKEEMPAEEMPAAPAEPAPVETGPVETIGGTAPTLLEPFGPSAVSATGTEESYGPVKRGDTLSKIALRSKPADVTLEQMLVLLFRNNPDAFAGKNMNRLKTGKIIRFPQSEEYASLTPPQARQEVRVQSRDWLAYKERLAAAVAETMPSEAEPAQQTAAGQITPKVEEGPKAKAEPKEVLKLSEGAPAGGGTAAGGQQRTRALEEELVARNKAISEANERVARLEKTIGDLQALLEVKNQGMAELQKQAGGAAPAASGAAAKKPAAPAQATPAAPATSPAAPTPTPKAEGSVPDMRPQTPTGPGQEKAPAQPAPQAAAPTPKPRPKPPAPPPPPPSLVDRILEQPYYLGAAVLLLLVVGFGASRALRRRREVKSESEDYAPAGGANSPDGIERGSAQFQSGDTDSGPAGRAQETSEEVDPLEEAEIFLAYGRDTQAEELLKEALSSNPRRYEIHTKLLEIYAKRQDKAAFEGIARELQQGTGGRGEYWDRAVKLGYQIDPSNTRYADGKSGGEEPESVSEEESLSADRLDFEVGLDDDTVSTTATDINLDEASQFERTQIIGSAGIEEPSLAAASPTAMDFKVELPAVESPATESQAKRNVADARAEPGGNSIDFDFDVSKLGETEPRAAEGEPETSGGLDFDVGSFSARTQPEQSDSASATVPALDLSGISLDLDGTSTVPANPADKGEKWYEVQTKFDLAKAYQEMGDKDGAREILREVIAEGDKDQQAAAQAVLTSLD